MDLTEEKFLRLGSYFYQVCDSGGFAEALELKKQIYNILAPHQKKIIDLYVRQARSNIVDRHNPEGDTYYEYY